MHLLLLELRAEGFRLRRGEMSEEDDRESALDCVSTLRGWSGGLVTSFTGLLRLCLSEETVVKSRSSKIVAGPVDSSS